MALTPSNMLPLGTLAPDFELVDTENNLIRLSEARGPQGTVVMFICNHCPYVEHLKPALPAFAEECNKQGVAVIAINSNDVEAYPDDHPTKMAEDKKRFHYPFPYLFDESQAVAKAYEAACTPDFYLFDADLKLAYRGQFDGSRPGNAVPVTGSELRRAVELVVHKQKVPEPHQPSMGCNIKWKS